MNITLNFFSPSVSFLKEKANSSLTIQQKKIIAIALLALSLFVICYLTVKHCCFKIEYLNFNDDYDLSEDENFSELNQEILDLKEELATIRKKIKSLNSDDDHDNCYSSENELINIGDLSDDCVLENGSSFEESDKMLDKESFSFKYLSEKSLSKDFASSNNEISTLPEDILTEIFGYLNFRNLIQCGSVCTQWDSLVNQENLWKNLCQKRFFINKNPTQKTKETWKLTYQALFEKSLPLAYPHGTKVRGKVRKGKLQGYGKITYCNGIEEEGFFQNGTLTKGIQTHPSQYAPGEYYSFLKGPLIKEGYIFKGVFKNGKLHTGIQADLDDSYGPCKTYEGKFKNNKIIQGKIKSGKKQFISGPMRIKYLEEGKFGNDSCLHGKGRKTYFEKITYKKDTREVEVKKEEGLFQAGVFVYGRRTFAIKHFIISLLFEEGEFKKGHLVRGKKVYKKVKNAYDRKIKGEEFNKLLSEEGEFNKKQLVKGKKIYSDGKIEEGEFDKHEKLISFEERCINFFKSLQ